MDVMRQFEEFCKEYEDFRELAIQGITLADNEAEEQMLFSLAIGLDQLVDSLKREFPKGMDQLKASVDDMKSSLAEAQKEIEQAEQSIQGMQAEAEQPPPAPPAPEADWDLPTLDANLNRYRAELLGLLTGRKPKEKAQGEDSREIWQDWSRMKDE